MPRATTVSDDRLLILRGDEIAGLLDGRERELVDEVSAAYRAHGAGRSSLPHSTFLRFPGDAVNRIIALPAYLGDGFDVAGMKWIASFPGNLERGLARASAVMVLNACDTGRPVAVLEGSVISARRTAASAALAARTLAGERFAGPVGLVGTGLINSEIARFLSAVVAVERFVLFDLARQRAERFAAELRRRTGIEAEVAASLEELLARCRLTSFATTAVEPHVPDLAACPAAAVVLHVSLRDLAPEAILAADNVVDDPDHVCRERTSVHLAEQATGSRDFIRCTLADVLAGTAPEKPEPDRVTVFSPFGLGILDLALARRTLAFAGAAGAGTWIDSFLPGDAGRA